MSAEVVCQLPKLKRENWYFYYEEKTACLTLSL